MCKTICIMQHFLLQIMVGINIVYFFKKLSSVWLNGIQFYLSNVLGIDVLVSNLCVSYSGNGLKNNSLSLEKGTGLVTLVEFTEN